MVFNISGETFVATGPSITGLMSEEELEALEDEKPETEKHDGPKTELIIIIVVAVVVVLVTVTLGITCYVSIAVLIKGYQVTLYPGHRQSVFYAVI